MAHDDERTGTVPSAALSAFLARWAGTPATKSAEACTTVMELASRLPETGARDVGASDRKELRARARSLATVIARAFRERRLSGREPGVRGDVTGIRSLVEGPTYEAQFHERWSSFCMPGAPESNEGYLADLVALYRYALDIEAQPSASGKEKERITLAERRPDLASMVLDENALATRPMLQSVNAMLAALIRADATVPGEGDDKVSQALSQARHPFGLPYEQAMADINFAVGRAGYLPGDLVRMVDPEFPYFVAHNLGGARSGAAMRMDAGLGVRQQEILLEPLRTEGPGANVDRRSPTTGSRSSSLSDTAEFYPRHYGVTSGSELADVSQFCRSTGLRKDDVEELFAQERWLPAASPHVNDLPSPESFHFGAVFVNGGQGPAVTIATDPDGDLHTIKGASIAHFDRVQRLIRIKAWMDISLSDADRLTTAILRAEFPGATGAQLAPSENTIRALGLFRLLRLRFGITADTFAELLAGPAAYGQNGRAIPFDRIFNRPDLFPDAIVADGTLFHLAPRDNELPRMARVSSALGIGLDVFLYLARFIHQAMADEADPLAGAADPTLPWSYDVLAALYRLARLPALVGATPMEGMALLQLLLAGSPRYVRSLVRVSVGGANANGLVDTLNVVHALADALAWCREQDLDIPWLYAVLVPQAAPPSVLPYDTLIRQVKSSLQGLLLLEEAFVDAGLPALEGGEPDNSWLGKVRRKYLADTHGLITSLLDEAAFAASALEVAREIIAGVVADNDGTMATRLAGVLVDHRVAQEAVLLEAVGAHLSLDGDVVRQVLVWGDAPPYQLASLAIDAGDDATEDATALAAMLARVAVRGQVVSRLALGAEALRFYLARPDVFEPSVVAGLPPSLMAGRLSFGVIFGLVRYQAIVRASAEPEATITEYLALVNDMGLESLSAENLSLVRDHAATRVAAFTGMSIRVVLDIAAGINEFGIIRNVWELDRFQRVRQCCERAGLDAGAVFALGALDANASDQTYGTAASLALNALARTSSTSTQPDTREMGQSEQSITAVSTERLVAGSDQVATVTITVRDFNGRARSGIDIQWATTLGVLSVTESSTNGEGVATVQLNAGKKMGVAVITATFGLAKRLVVAPVTIDCDDTSLLISGWSEGVPPAVPAGYQGKVVVAVMVDDKYGNPAIGRQVLWSVDLEEPRFEPLQSTVGNDGIATTVLSSRSAGANAAVKAECAVDATTATDVARVTFTNRASITAVHLDAVLARDVASEAWCEVRGIDGKPVAGVDVTWNVVEGEATFSDGGVSDARGLATIQVTPRKAANLQISASLADGDALVGQVSSRLSTVYVPAFIELDPPRGVLESTIKDDVGSTIIAFRQVVGPSDVAGIKVTWTINGMPAAIVTTPSGGVVTWTHAFSHAMPDDKPYEVTAICGPDGDGRADYAVKFNKA